MRDKVRKTMEKEKDSLKKFSQKWKGNNQFQKEEHLWINPLIGLLDQINQAKWRSLHFEQLIKEFNTFEVIHLRYLLVWIYFFDFREKMSTFIFIMIPQRNNDVSAIYNNGLMFQRIILISFYLTLEYF